MPTARGCFESLDAAADCVLDHKGARNLHMAAFKEAPEGAAGDSESLASSLAAIPAHIGHDGVDELMVNQRRLPTRITMNFARQRFRLLRGGVDRADRSRS